ncbi:enoyl-CoA hydratase/isomerase family protein [Motiliproteus sp. MSK22-1]|uniref:enoyl-CoA hydratase/isomerase family protein n=1 Tax=Motiliproteus sp. MSK22-1 TaxID=1897630 RepID=UPI000977ECB8|nr:enoyl-CoA hydratase/isomerase family protein [Motiliproteus sp. MSK22-1]OMH37607.1 gamma-carboxygeranoyl-CoA hydratase [Motiliproteus sp. MSK22-1]
MQSNDKVLLTRDERGIATLCLNRPEVHNAFDDEVISLLIAHLETLKNDPTIRALVLRSNGKNFSAGADLNWMRSMAKNNHQENIEDAGRLALLMKSLNELPKPSIALVQGAAYGGAVGLAACCDIVVACEASSFCLSEVKIGLVPAVISPYVVRAIGERQSRRYFLTAEAFSSSQAQAFGLIHEVVSDQEHLDEARERLLKPLLNNSPQAVTAAKDLVFAVSQKEIDTQVIDDTAERIAGIRVSSEGQEGLNAFLNKRKPNWIA